MNYLGIEPARPRVAVFGFTGCEGCQLQLANRESNLPDFLALLEIRNFREISSERLDDYDIALVEEQPGNQVERVLRAGAFAVTTELAPPDSADAEEVYRRALALDARISIATVYRTVRLLEEKGILERRDFGGGRARYDPADRGHHHHLIDRCAVKTLMR